MPPPRPLMTPTQAASAAKTWEERQALTRQSREKRYTAAVAYVTEKYTAPVIVVPYTPRQILVLPRDHIFDGPWQPPTDTTHQTTPTPAVWNHPTHTEPTPGRDPSTGLGQALYPAMHLLWLDLSTPSSPLPDTQTALALRAQAWYAHTPPAPPHSTPRDPTPYSAPATPSGANAPLHTRSGPGNP